MAIRRWMGHVKERNNLISSLGGKGEVHIRPAGYFRKMRPLDCGNPRCHICHYDKIMGSDSARQMRKNIDYRQQIEDLYE